MECPACGNPVSETAKFCGHCGTLLDQSRPDEEAQAQEPEEGACEASGQEGQENAVEPTAADALSSEEEAADGRAPGETGLQPETQYELANVDDGSVGEAAPLDGPDPEAPADDGQAGDSTEAGAARATSNAKPFRAMLAKNKKAAIAIVVVAGITAALLAYYLVLPLTTYLGAKQKFENGEYAAAAADYGSIAGFMDAEDLKAEAERADSYTRGVAALAAGKYSEAIKYFVAAGEYQDASDQLKNAKTLKTYSEADSELAAKDYESAGNDYASLGDYEDAKEKAAQCADSLMSAENFSAAKSIYEKLGTDYEEKTSQADTAIANKANMDSAEEKIADGDFNGALELYNQIPDEFTCGGKNAGTRKQQLNNAVSVAGLAGTYKATNCNVVVTRTHRRSGSWNNWYSDQTGGAKVTVKASMADDGTVSFSGEVTYWVYTSFSSVGSLVKSGQRSQEFTCGANPGTIQLDDETTLSYDGSWHLRYNEVDYSEDVYFYYTYSASFDYSK